MSETKKMVKVGAQGLMPESLDEVYRAATAFHRSGIGGWKSPEEAMVAMLTGIELGFGLSTSARTIFIVHGKPSMEGKAMLALIRASGKCKFFSLEVEGEGDKMKAVATFQRADMPEPKTMEYTVADAKTARLWGKGGAWSSYPKDMLTWKLVARVGNKYFSDVTLGVAVKEDIAEIRDGGTAVEVAPDTEPDPLLLENNPVVDAHMKRVTDDGEVVEPTEEIDTDADYPPEVQPTPVEALSPKESQLEKMDRDRATDEGGPLFGG